MEKFPEHFVPGTNPSEKAIIQEAIQQQRQIGCIFTLRGYLSTRWGSVIMAASEEHHLQTAHNWTSEAIIQLWSMATKKAWEERNEVLHNSLNTTISQSDSDARIRYFLCKST
jgi:hypothetical protein